MITLPDKTKDEGLEARVLLAECRGPSFYGYTLADAKTCMEFMDLVLWNRVKNFAPFGAKHGTLLSVVTARGQFAGFEQYPNYSAGIRKNIQDMLDIANNVKDQRHASFAAHIQVALDIANSTSTILDPTPSGAGKLVGWRTAGSGSPGAGFTLFRTVSSTDFYSK